MAVWIRALAQERAREYVAGATVATWESLARGDELSDDHVTQKLTEAYDALIVARARRKIVEFLITQDNPTPYALAREVAGLSAPEFLEALEGLEREYVVAVDRTIPGYTCELAV